MKKFYLLITAILFISSIANSQIINGNFDQGRNAGWIEQSTGGYTLIGTGPFFASTEIDPPVNPRTGSWMARIGGFSYEDNSITQTVTLPNTSPLYLAFYAQTRSSSTSECAGVWVGAKVSILINGQEVYYAYLCKYNDVLNWTAGFIDLSAIAGQTAEIKFKAESANSVWSYLYIDDVSITSSTTGVDDKAYIYTNKLDQNYPNPFNPTTNISFSIPSKSFVSLKVFDALGREVSNLVSEELPAGNYSRVFDASGLASGLYFYQLRAGEFLETKKIILMK